MLLRRFIILGVRREEPGVGMEEELGVGMGEEMVIWRAKELGVGREEMLRWGLSLVWVGGEGAGRGEVGGAGRGAVGALVKPAPASTSADSTGRAVVVPQNPRPPTAELFIPPPSFCTVATLHLIRYPFRSLSRCIQSQVRAISGCW